jgi:hypothetical protein
MLKPLQLSILSIHLTLSLSCKPLRGIKTCCFRRPRQNWWVDWTVEREQGLVGRMDDSSKRTLTTEEEEAVPPTADVFPQPEEVPHKKTKAASAAAYAPVAKAPPSASVAKAPPAAPPPPRHPRAAGDSREQQVAQAADNHIQKASASAAMRGSADPKGNGTKGMFERAEEWVRAGVPYSQSKYRDGFRTDCSGYLAYAWGLDSRPAYTTRHFFKNSFPGADAILERDPRFTRDTAKFDGIHMCDMVSLADLQPGDALYKACPPGGNCGHVMLVAGVTGNEIKIYHQTGAGGAVRDRLLVGGSMENDGFKVTLQRGKRSLWNSTVWGLRRREVDCQIATQ